MLRFITLFWNDENSEAARVARIYIELAHSWQAGWACVARSKGYATFHLLDRATDQIHTLPNAAGVILGSLFRKTPAGSSSEAVELGEREAAEILKTRGKSLIEKYWGHYVAVLRDASANISYVLRDCSGAVHCFVTEHSGVTIAFSDARDLYRLPLPPPSLNWRYISAFLFNDDLRVAQCGLNEITEILAGECHCIGDSRASRFAWDPREVSRSDPIEDYDEAVLQLRDVTQQCIDAFARRDRKILLSLSGGFDSAVVLGSLARAPVRPATVCLNRYAAVPQEDERMYARLAASDAGVELAEVQWPAEGDDLAGCLESAPLTPKPAITQLSLPDILVRNSYARRLSAERTWTGQGGDHLFFQYRTSLTAADYVHRKGVISPGFLSAVKDSVCFSKNSYAHVIRESVRLGHTRATWVPQSATGDQMPFISKAAQPSDIETYISHPWFLTMEDLPPAKQLHIRLIADLVNRPASTAGSEHAAERHPLISQPIIETCLRIPTYLLVRGGRHRALARDAFKDRVPAPIIAREAKGSIRSHINNTLYRNKAFFSDLLLDGLLVSQGLLERRLLEPYVRGLTPLRVEQYFPLLACISAEIWARSWSGASAIRSVA